MRISDQKPYLDAVDSVLEPLGFKRRSRSQEWIKASQADAVWVHLSFGKYTTIHPSFGVNYLDLEEAWSALPGGVYGTMSMLDCLEKTPESYSTDFEPRAIAADIEEHALGEAELLRDHHFTASLLLADEVKRWPVPSFSHRIRLAPVLLAEQGLRKEAEQTIQRFADEAVGRDQLVPSYGEFCRVFRSLTRS